MVLDLSLEDLDYEWASMNFNICSNFLSNRYRFLMKRYFQDKL